MHIIVLAGGQGTRLWPASRKNFPKQFLRLFSNKPLISETLERLGNFDNMLIATNREQKFILNRFLSRDFNNIDIIDEPSMRNTLPAIALSVRYLKEKYDLKEKSIIFVTPSDHVIKPQEKFIDTIKKAEISAQEGYIVTMGIKPTKPSTGYGYIEIGSNIRDKTYKINRFIEKPSYEKARELIKNNKYYWNSGMFMFPLYVFEEELETYEKNIFSIYNKGYDYMLSNYKMLTNISIDYAIMEKTEKAACVVAELDWSDIGSWDSVYEVKEKDSEGNAIKGNALTNNTSNSLIYNESSKKLITAVDVKNLLIVDTPDALLIAKRGSSQKVKDIVNNIKYNNEELVNFHTKVYRPWGTYQVLDEDENFKVKRIEVFRGEKLSLQLHKHRDEHWTVVKGEGVVTLNNDKIKVKENSKIFIEKNTKHTIENTGDATLTFIEVQCGSYLGEDDIVRFEDKYGRV